MKLGKRSPTYDHRDLLMSRYVDTHKLPDIPEAFGHEGVISDWRMLANDKVGCCVFSGAAHETMLLSSMGGIGRVFTETSVLSDYSAVTGYTPLNLSSDQGTLVRDAMKYRRDVGVEDFMGNRHKIGVFVSIEPGSWKNLLTALYIFGTVGIGFQFPNSAMDQFSNFDTWSVVPGATISGGHYVPLIGFRENLYCVTWGREQQMTRTFYETYCDEAWAYFTEEYLQSGKTPEGFAKDDLLSDLAAIQS
jgi:hypothetical protein